MHVLWSSPIDNRQPHIESADADEHIVIDGDGSDGPDKPRTIDGQLRLHNRPRGQATNVTFYAEGYVNVRIEDARKQSREALLELKFLDPEFRVKRRKSGVWAAVGLGALAAAVVSQTLLRGSLSSSAAAVLTAVSGTGGLCCLMMFLYRSEERIRFWTRNGRAPVLELTASFGCIRKFRRAAKRIAQRIKVELSAADRSTPNYLRDEMRAHYALRDRGTISERMCSESTSNILAKFG